MIGPQVSHWPKPELLNHENSNVDGENYAFEQPRSTKNFTEDVLAENRNIQTFYDAPARFVYIFQMFVYIFQRFVYIFQIFVYYLFRPVRHDIPLAPQDAINDFEFPIIQQSPPLADDSNYNYDYHNYIAEDDNEYPPPAPPLVPPPPPPIPPLVPVFQPIPIQAGSLGSKNQGKNKNSYEDEIENSTENNSDDFIDIMETIEDTTNNEINHETVKSQGKKFVV